MYNQEEQRRLAMADQERNWPEVPGDCPPEIRSKILHYRAKELGIAKDPEVEAAKDRLDALKTTVSAA